MQIKKKHKRLFSDLTSYFRNTGTQTEDSISKQAKEPASSENTKTNVKNPKNDLVKKPTLTNLSENPQNYVEQYMDIFLVMMK